MSDKKKETISDIVREMRVYAKNCNRLGNAAKMREALSEISNLADALDIDNPNVVAILDKCRDALAEPERNCDRPECATTKAAQEVWRKEDGGKTAYYEWLLATSTKEEAK